MDSDDGLSIMIVPEGGRSTRTLRLSQRRLRLLFAAFATLGVATAMLFGTWWYLAIRSGQVTQLETRVAELQQENARVGELAEQLSLIETRYADLARLMGARPDSVGATVWLPPSRTPSTQARAGSVDVPSSWPLTERGFVTQEALLSDTTGGHPGLDIAIATGSYVRAAGSGTVAEVGEDPIYGLFVAVDHARGYRTIYGHVSELLVTTGQKVLQNEIIALSGSTGRSTAPHLHFEVLKDGVTVDPLTVVRQP